MNEEANISRNLREVVNETLSGKYKATFACSVQLEVKSDKTEAKILVLTAYRLLLLGNKSPRKIEVNIPLLDVATVESKNYQKLLISTEGKKIPLKTSAENGKESDLIILQILLALSNIFPDVSVEKLISKIDVLPASRLKEIFDQKQSLMIKDSRPCGNYSEAYRCWCDYRGVEAMEDVAWDVDNIYLSQNSREFCLNDFDHVDPRHFLLILSALEHNAWFDTLNISDIKMSPEVISQVRKILKSNSAIRKLILVNAGIRSEVVGKLIKSLLANQTTVVSCLNLSGNSVEDKGVKSLCSLISSLPRGLKELQISSAAVTSRGINSLGFSFTQNLVSCENLRVLDLSENSTKGEDISNLLAFFTKSNVLETIRLSSMECSLENLISSLFPGCCKRLRHLDVSGNYYSRKSGKDAICPLGWKQLFSSAESLKVVNLSNCRLPPDAVKSVLLGIACNEIVSDLKLNLSGNGLGESGAAEVLEVSLPSITNITILDISDNGFDADLANVLTKIGQNQSLKKLYIGKNLNNIKPKNVGPVMESIVQLIHKEGCPIELVSLENMRLKADTTVLLNALGANNSLKELDISGNQMGDNGAKMLSKALLINKRLTAIHLDNNNITLSGFQDLAEALEKNYVVKHIPTPLNDAANSLRLNPEKTEAAFKRISAALERNHKPKKLAVEPNFHLQQGIIINSAKEFLESTLTKLNESTQKMTSALQRKINNDASADTYYAQSLLSQAECLGKDAVAFRHLLLELQKVAAKADEESLVQNQLNSMATGLQDVIAKQIELNISDMVKCSQKQCPAVLNDKNFSEKLLSSLSQLCPAPKDFVNKLILEGVSAEISNSVNELNLKIALSLSENVFEQLVNELERTTMLLNTTQVNQPSTSSQAQQMVKGGGELKMTIPSEVSSSSENDKQQDLSDIKRKSRLHRGLRPQSSFGVQPIDKECHEQEGGAESKAVLGSLSSPTAKLEQGFGNQSPGILNGGSGMILETSEQKLSHLGKDRPKRLKNIPATRPMIGQKIEENNDEEVDKFFSTTTTTTQPPAEKSKTKKQKESKEKSKGKSNAPLLPSSKHNKTKKGDDADCGELSPDDKKQMMKLKKDGGSASDTHV